MHDICKNSASKILINHRVPFIEEDLKIELPIVRQTEKYPVDSTNERHQAIIFIAKLNGNRSGSDSF